MPIIQSDNLLLTFPEQIGLPSDSSKLNCISVLDKLLAAVECVIYPAITTPNTVRVSLKFADGVKSISPSDRFMFTMQNIRNPPTLKPSDSFHIYVVNKDLITINSMTEGITVTTNASFIVQRA